MLPARFLYHPTLFLLLDLLADFKAPLLLASRFNPGAPWLFSSKSLPLLRIPPLLKKKKDKEKNATQTFFPLRLQSSNYKPLLCTDQLLLLINPTKQPRFLPLPDWQETQEQRRLFSKATQCSRGKEGDLKKKERERERDEKKERLALLNVREGGGHIWYHATWNWLNALLPRALY